jgi:hypothetical protein
LISFTKFWFLEKCTFWKKKFNIPTNKYNYCGKICQGTIVMKTPDTMVIRPLRAMITVMQACRTLGNFLDVMPAAGAAWPMNRTRKIQSSFGLIIKKPIKKRA